MKLGRTNGDTHTEVACASSHKVYGLRVYVLRYALLLQQIFFGDATIRDRVHVRVYLSPTRYLVSTI